MLKRFVAVALLLVLAGCETTLHKGDLFTQATAPTDDEALVYIYRPHSPPYWRQPMVKVDGKEIFDLHNKSYSYIYLKPGEYQVVTDWSWDAGPPDQEITVKVQSGHTYYLRLGGDMQFSSGYQSLNVNVSAPLNLVPAEDGLRELQACMYVAPKQQRIN